jgi:hypothetical protein
MQRLAWLKSLAQVHARLRLAGDGRLAVGRLCRRHVRFAVLLTRLLLLLLALVSRAPLQLRGRQLPVWVTSNGPVRTACRPGMLPCSHRRCPLAACLGRSLLLLLRLVEPVRLPPVLGSFRWMSCCAAPPRQCRPTLWRVVSCLLRLARWVCLPHSPWALLCCMWILSLHVSASTLALSVLGLRV